MLFREQNFWIWNLVLDSRARTFYFTSTTVQSWFNLCPCIRDWQLSTICRVKSCWSWSNILWWLIYGCFEGLRDAWYTEKADTLPVNGIGPQWWITHSSPPPPSIISLSELPFTLSPRSFLKSNILVTLCLRYESLSVSMPNLRLMLHRFSPWFFLCICFFSNVII